MPGHGGRAHVHRKAADALLEAGPDRDQLALVAHRDRDLPVASVGFPGSRRRRQRAQEADVDLESVEVPLLLEGFLHAHEIALLVGHGGPGQLEVVQLHDRVDLQVADGVGGLAHHLAMDLALRRHVDHRVAQEARLAAQAPLGLQALDALVFLLGLAERREVGLRGKDLQLGKLAGAQRHLAAPAHGTPAAHGIDVDAQAARGCEHGGSEREFPAASRRHEDHLRRGRRRDLAHARRAWRGCGNTFRHPASLL